MSHLGCCGASLVGCLLWKVLNLVWQDKGERSVGVWLLSRRHCLSVGGTSTAGQPEAHFSYKNSMEMD
jgi:hypothetical protein